MHCTILDYEFDIDIGGYPPIYSRVPTYGPHEKLTIMTHIKNVLKNKWICDCGGAW